MQYLALLHLKIIENLPTIIEKNYVLSPWPWPRPFLSLASRGPVLEKLVFGHGLGLEFFLIPWPRKLCPRLHLWYAFYLWVRSHKDKVL